MRQVLLALLAAGSMFAQTSGEINGRVTDASKAVTPGATVTAVNTDRRTQRATKANEQGYYSLPSLDPGAYEITVELAGFRPVTHTGIKLDVNQSIRPDFTVEVGQVTEKVQVTGEAPLLAANTGGLGTVVTEEKISDLPAISAVRFRNSSFSPGTGCAGAAPRFAGRSG
jgi:hypothetical protein